MPKRQKVDRVAINVRMRESLRARLEKAAKARKVSLNAEAVYRLEQSFARDAQESTDAKLDEVIETSREMIEVIRRIEAGVGKAAGKATVTGAGAAIRKGQDNE